MTNRTPEGVERFVDRTMIVAEITPEFCYRLTWLAPITLNQPTVYFISMKSAADYFNQIWRELHV